MNEKDFKDITRRMQEQPYSVAQRITLYVVWLLIVWGVCFTVGFIEHINIKHELRVYEIKSGLGDFEVRRAR